MPKTTTVLDDGTIIWACRSKRCICDSCKKDQRERTKALDKERYRKEREALGFTVPFVRREAKDPKPTIWSRLSFFKTHSCPCFECLDRPCPRNTF